MTIVNSAWLKYRDQMFPDGTTAQQNKECHQAFMAGATIVFGLMNKFSNSLTEEQAMVALDQISEELLAYASAKDQQGGS